MAKWNPLRNRSDWMKFWKEWMPPQRGLRADLVAQNQTNENRLQMMLIIWCSYPARTWFLRNVGSAHKADGSLNKSFMSRNAFIENLVLDYPKKDSFKAAVRKRCLSCRVWGTCLDWCWREMLKQMRQMKTGMPRKKVNLVEHKLRIA